MNQRTRKRGFLLNRGKKSQKPSKKQHKSCFSMHSHPFIFSIMCKCSYAVKKEHHNKPVEAPIRLPESQQQERQTNAKDSIFSTTLNTKHECSRKSEAAPSTPSKASMIKRGKLKKRVTIGSNHSSADIDEGGGDEAEWPPSADEDYIVFCFEEDGEFRVVMEENSSPRPQYLKVEEERFYFSPRLQSDGIRSATRFKQEVVEYEGKGDHVVESRGRVDEAVECKEMEEIKSRGLLDDDDQEEVEGIDLTEDVVEFSYTSTGCVRESTDSSEASWERILELTDVDQETGLSSLSLDEQDSQMSTKEAEPESPSSMKENCLLSKKMADDEESVYLSSESQQEESQDSDEHSGRGSAETSESTSRSEIEEGGEDEEKEEEVQEDEQLEDDHEESARHSVVSSNKSNEESDRISSSSFEFPELQWEWIGSPDIWPRSVTPKIMPFKKHKSRKVCLRLC